MIHFFREIAALQEINFKSENYTVHYFQFLCRYVMKIDQPHFPLK